MERVKCLLEVEFVDTIKDGTLFTTFHHLKSNINALFGDESDSKTKTARFKSVKVDIINIEDVVAIS